MHNFNQKAYLFCFIILYDNGAWKCWKQCKNVHKIVLLAAHMKFIHLFIILWMKLPLTNDDVLYNTHNVWGINSLYHK